MSSIAFSTRKEAAYLRGAERYHMSYITNGIFLGLLTDELDELKRIISVDYLDRTFQRVEALFEQKQHYEYRIEKTELLRDIHCAIRVGMSAKFRTENGQHDCWPTVLNTALVYGSDAVRLATMLHGQCELHLWVAGENRAWMADIIEKGLEEKIFRQNMGWNDIMILLRKSKRGAVVTSYSVCDTFDWHDKLPDEMELTPEQFNSVYFGEGFTVNDLHEYARAQKIAEGKQAYA